ncbi:DUF1127 domain-containing protein [Phyllobacterium myrsinacearum]|uniref:Uncharacterized protein YjiS (DUF1127 family) n=1 Tax=Phyllobacterium myrsinacearum TaxID=28101 RepID=A0A839ELR3_9HYPH|nr:DUF1127 domain-containing protein [Phyllobacterium myrsinacearum]MBA8878424.1 uncharacterized protein YjiS (DUF1127 family) [Phyllobacterium myrsinacearum]
MSTIDAIERECADVKRVDRDLTTRALGNNTTAFDRMMEWLCVAVRKHRTRIHLSELSAEQLKDIGMTPFDARRESRRFFWD